MQPVVRAVIAQPVRVRGSAPRPAARAEDTELLEAVGQGSEPAFEELRRRYRRAVERVCRALLGGEAEDCVQEVFTRVWRKAHLYDGRRGSAAGWLLTLARRTVLNLRAADGRREVALLGEAGSVEPPDASRLWLEAALAQLPERQRQVIELAYFDDLSQGAIAAELGVPLGSVKSWTRRGLTQLATLLGEELE